MNMENIDFRKEAEKYKEEYLKDLFELLKINSVEGTDVTEETPVGSGPRKALDKFMSFGERDGYKTKIVKNIAGHIEIGQGDKIFGVLGHVDVVPVNEEEWTTPPFSPEIRNDRIYARGVLDDKGPILAGYYAVKLLDNLGVEFKKRIRVIIGTNEETGFKCVETYFKHEEQPEMGFTPDGDYPLVYAEKCIGNFKYIFNKSVSNESLENNSTLLSFNSGTAQNVVPSKAEVELEILKLDLIDIIKEKAEMFKEKEGVIVETNLKDNILKITFEGKSAHASTPDAGLNAGTKMAKFLNGLDKENVISLDVQGKKYVEVIDTYFADDNYGEKLGFKYNDNEMGDATYSYGIFKYEKDGDMFVDCDCRYPQKFNLLNKLEETKIDGVNIKVERNEEAHYISPEDELVQKLLASYRKYTGDMSDPIVLGGGTYAKVLERGVAFGALFPDSDDTMHQKDENILVEDLMLSIAIFAEGIYNLCCK